MPRKPTDPPPPKTPANNPALSGERGLPANTDAERFLLGSILLDGTRLEELLPVVTENDFSLESHRRIWRTIIRIHETGEVKLDRVTVADHLFRYGELEQIGGVSYLVDLDTGLPRVPSLDSYVKILREHAARRNIALAAQKAMTSALLGEERPQEVLSKFEAEVSVVERSLDLNNEAALQPGQIVQAEGGLQGFLDKQAMGIASGWEDLDDLIYGLREGVITVGAFTSVGKSAWVGALALSLARRGIACLVHTLEMSGKEYLLRLALGESRVPAYKIRRQLLNEEDRRNLRRALKDLADLPLYIDDTENINIWDFERSASRAIRKQGVQVVMLDQLQNLDWQSPFRGIHFQDERVALAYCTRRLKLLSRRHRIPLIVVSHLHRRADGKNKDNDPRPRLSDLHGSSTIEKDSDVVIMLHREELIRPAASEYHGVAEIIVRKSRHSPVGTVYLAYEKSFLRFTGLSDERKKLYKTSLGN